MDNIKASNKIFSIEDAKKLSKKSLPKIVYDIIDGASGDEKLSEINKNIEIKNLLGLIIACVSPENYKKNINEIKINI